MADVAGHPRPDLTRSDPSGDAIDPLTVGFFELLRRLETETARFGRAGLPADEPARLGQRVRLSVATRDVAGFRPPTDARAAEVDVEVLGLLGPEGALPLHMTRWVMERLSDRWFAGDDDRETSDTTFLDFCNMLQHRLISLYWRAWGDARAEVQVELGTGGRVRALSDALARLVPGPMDPRNAAADLLRRHGTSVASDTYSPARLTRIVAEYLDAPVALVELVGHWIDIPAALQTRLGTVHAALGQGAVAGARVFDRQGRAELRVGPLSLATYERLADDAALMTGLAGLIRFVTGREIDFDLRLVLARDAVPAPVLGQARIGRTAWVSPPLRQDADDLLFRAITADPGLAA